MRSAGTYRLVRYSYVSPRHRAQKTLELLDVGCHERLPWSDQEPSNKCGLDDKARVQITEDIREWDYGDYEGKTSATIREERSKSGEGKWDIWHDG